MEVKLVDDKTLVIEAFGLPTWQCNIHSRKTMEDLDVNKQVNNWSKSNVGILFDDVLDPMVQRACRASCLLTHVKYLDRHNKIYPRQLYMIVEAQEDDWAHQSSTVLPLITKSPSIQLVTITSYIKC